jgi:hypothetical protein
MKKKKYIILLILLLSFTAIYFRLFYQKDSLPYFKEITAIELSKYTFYDTLWCNSQNSFTEYFEDHGAFGGRYVYIYTSQLANYRLEHVKYRPKVRRDTLFIYSESSDNLNSESGWWNIKRNGTFWNSIFSFSKSIGSMTKIERPSDSDTLEILKYYGAVFQYENGQLHKVANMDEITNLFDDVKGQGIFYIAEPGIGLTNKIYLPTACK